MKREHVTAWAARNLPGESVDAHVVGGPANGASLDASDESGPGHRAELQNQVTLRGLDPERRVSDGLSSLCLILTGQRLAIVSVGGLITVKPKELLHSCPRDGFRCEWWVNDTAADAWYRNVLLFLDDGRWAGAGIATRLLGKTMKTATLAEEFTAALGPAAVEVDWRGGPASG